MPRKAKKRDRDQVHEDGVNVEDAGSTPVRKRAAREDSRYGNYVGTPERDRSDRGRLSFEQQVKLLVMHEGGYERLYGFMEHHMKASGIRTTDAKLELSEQVFGWIFDFLEGKSREVRILFASSPPFTEMLNGVCGQLWPKGGFSRVDQCSKVLDLFERGRAVGLSKDQLDAFIFFECFDRLDSLADGSHEFDFLPMASSIKMLLRSGSQALVREEMTKCANVMRRDEFTTLYSNIIFGRFLTDAERGRVADLYDNLKIDRTVPALDLSAASTHSAVPAPTRYL